MTFAQLINRIRTETRYKSCFVSDSSCSTRIVRSHSIQNSRILRRISLNGMVLTIQASDRILGFSSVGRKTASTFSGFCSFHDDKIFKLIETDDFSPIDAHFVRHAYRALALEYNKKTSILRMYTKILELMETKQWQRYLRDCTDIKPSRASPAETYRDVVSYITGSQIELDNMNRFRALFDVFFETSHNDFLSSFSVSFPSEYPIAATSSITIEHDFRGNPVNVFPKSDICDESKPLYLTIFPQNGRTHVLLSHYERDRDTYRPLRNDLKSMRIRDLKVAVTNLIANHIENFYVSPVYWKRLDEQTKVHFLEVFRQTLFFAGSDLAQLKDINIFV